jgi:hypothetical protein
MRHKKNEKRPTEKRADGGKLAIYRNCDFLKLRAKENRRGRRAACKIERNCKSTLPPKA